MAVRLTSEQKRLVESCMKMAYKLANKYAAKNPTMSAEDIEQEAMMGLIEAATRYDPGRQVKFTTYSYPWILKFILNFIEQNLPRGLKPDKKSVQNFLYERMTEPQAEQFVNVFILTLGLDSSFSHRFEDRSLADNLGVDDHYPEVEADYVRYVADVADKILNGNAKAIYMEVITLAISGESEPITVAAANMGMQVEVVTEAFHESAIIVREHANANDRIRR